MAIKNYVVKELIPLRIEVPELKKNSFHKLLLLKNKELKKNLGLRSEPISILIDKNEYLLKFNGISGVFSFGDYEFEVIPKFISDNNNLWRKSIFNLISIANSKWIQAEKYSNLGTDKITFYDHISLIFIDTLNKSLLKDSIQTYSSQIVESRYLRGRLLINEQLSKILTNPGTLITEVDYFDTENEFNFLVNWTLLHLISRTNNIKTKAKLLELQSQIPQPQKFYTIPVLKSLPPQYKHYQDVIELCNLLATGNSISLNTGNKDGYGYILNMEKLYEGFIENILKRLVKAESSWSITPQSSMVFAEAKSEGDNDFFTIPDNKLFINNKPVMLIDAKYKASKVVYKNKRPVSSDIYQLFSSMVAHQCNVGLLIHPREKSKNMHKDLSLWQSSFYGNEYYIASYSIDISDISSVDKVNRLILNLKDKIKYLLKIQ
jgi:5-methylcytosine-specific restriction enzyme subunit McrC